MAGAERERLAEAARRERPWKKWGPYLSERQWGTVRENATRGVEAWNEVSHDLAGGHPPEPELPGPQP